MSEIKEKTEGGFTHTPEPWWAVIGEDEPANASLIAASPCMFEALKELLAFEEWRQTEGGATPPHLVGVHDRARAALAKAQGTEKSDG